MGFRFDLTIFRLQKIIVNHLLLRSNTIQMHFSPFLITIKDVNSCKNYLQAYDSYIEFYMCTLGFKILNRSEN